MDCRERALLCSLIPFTNKLKHWDHSTSKFPSKAAMCSGVSPLEFIRSTSAEFIESITALLQAVKTDNQSKKMHKNLQIPQVQSDNS